MLGKCKKDLTLFDQDRGRTSIKFTSLQEAKVTDDIIAVPLFTGNKKAQHKNGTQALHTKSDAYAGIGSYLKHSNAKEIIKKLLTCDRVISISTRISSFTILELANELNITSEELRQVRIASWCYRKLARRINLSLIILYCSTRFYESTP